MAVLFAQDSSTPAPTIPDLQKQIEIKDARIAQLTGQINAMVKLHAACYQALAQDEMELAGRR